MSLSAAHESKQIQRRCQGCGARRALFRHRGVVKADRDHTLCFECFRAERNRRRARLLASIPSPRPLRSALADDAPWQESTGQEMTKATPFVSMSPASATSAEMIDATYCRATRRVGRLLVPLRGRGVRAGVRRRRRGVGALVADVEAAAHRDDVRTRVDRAATAVVDDV